VPSSNDTLIIIDKKAGESVNEENQSTNESINLFNTESYWTVDDVWLWVGGVGHAITVLTAHSFVCRKYLFLLDTSTITVRVWNGECIVAEAVLVQE
jgi:hypothetical protein